MNFGVSPFESCAMSRPLRVLDAASSSAALQRIDAVLAQAGLSCERVSVGNLEALRAALDSRSWDAIVCCSPAAGLDAPAVARALQEAGREIPLMTGSDADAVAERLLDAGRAEAMRIARESKFRAFFERAPLGMLISAAAGRIREANPAAERMLGYGPGELAGLGPADLAAEPETGPTQRLLATALAEGASEETHRLRRKDGGSVTAALHALRLGPDRALILMEERVLRVEGEEAPGAGQPSEGAGIGVLVTDRDGRFVDCNPAAARLLGYSSGDLLRLSLAEAVPEEERERVRRGLERLNGDGDLEDEFRLLCKDGKLLWASLRAAALEGRLALACFEDISRQRPCVSDLNAARERFRVLFENSPLPTIEVDFSGLREDLPGLLARRGELAGMLAASPALASRVASQVTIRDRNRLAVEMLGAGGYEPSRLPPASLAALLEGLLDLAGGDECIHFEFPIDGPGGGPRTMLAGASVAPGHEEALSRVFITFADITERMRSEEELRRREAKYRAVIETSADGFWLIDPEGRILEVNDSYLRSSGYTREEMVGRHISTFEALHRAEDIRATFAVIKERGSALFETVHRAKDGSCWHVEVSASYWPIDGGRILAFQRDMVRRNRSETLLRARVRLSGIAEKGTLGDVMQAAVDEVELLTGSLYGFFHLLDEAGMVSPQAWSTRTAQTLGARLPAAPFPVSQAAVWARALETRAPEIRNDGAGRFAGWGAGEGGPETDRLLAVPVSSNDRVQALLVVAAKSSDYRDEDVEAAREIASISMDLVERKRAEQRQRAADERLSMALTASRMGVWEWDIATGALYRSPECGAIAAVEDFDQTIDSITRYVHPDDRRRAEEESARALAERRPFSVDLRLCPPGGEALWLRVLAQPRYGEDGQPRYLVGTVADITERKHAQEALRINAERLRLLVDANFDWIWEFDVAGRYTYVSPRCRDLLGYEPEEILGRTPFDLMTEAEAARLAPLVAEVIRERRPFVALENANRHKDGSLVVLETSGLPMLSAEGELIGYCGVDRDITGRKQAERRSAARESVSRALAASPTLEEAAPRILEAIGGRWDWDVGGVWLAGPTQRLELVGFWRRGQEMERVAQGPPPFAVPDGCLLEEARRTGRPVLKARSEHREGCADAEAAAAAGFDWTVLFPIRADDRTIGVVELWAHPAPSFGGRELELLAGCGNLIGEFVERRRAQQNVQRFVSYSPSILYALRLEHGVFRLHWASDNILQLTGYRAEEVDPRWWREHIHPEDRERVMAAHPRPYDIDHQILEFRFRRKDGSYFWLRDEKRLLRDATGAPSEVVGTWADITERILLEQQLRQSQKMEAVGSLAGGVAHDFNNLLTVINGYAQMMLNSVAPADPLRPSVEEIHKAGERAASLTRQLLAFSRKQVLEPQHLSLNRVVTELQSMLGRVVGEHITLRIAANAVHDAIWADRHQLEQVVMNLVLNARDAMPQGGSLTLETSEAGISTAHAGAPEARAGDYVVLSVTDTGMGMDQEVQARIFEPFFTTKSPDRGTGLGLSTVQGIVVQSGGFIEVCSTPGAGASFRVYLPASTRRETPEPPPKSLAAYAGDESILIVEDQSEVRQYAALALRKLGYRVFSAAGPAEALETCEHGGAHIDLLITDVVMPEMSGPELARHMLAICPGLRILYMSGHGGEMINQQGVEPEAVFLQKPFRPLDLAAKVREVLREPQRRSRILIADDEPGVRKFLRVVLETAGYEVVEAADGAQAMKEARRSSFDLILTDLVMPEQEGIETIRALRKEKPSIRIIAISGKFDKPYLRMAETLGADAVMPKPISPQALVARVGELLSRSP
jgi:PAS domain S-box-containing protein